MNRNKRIFRQILIILSLALLILLPAALITVPNIGDIRNNAFSKQIKQEQSLFSISSQSSDNVSKDSPFSLVITAKVPDTVSFNYVASIIDYDSNLVDIIGIDLPEGIGLKSLKNPTSFIIVPTGNKNPSQIEDLNPEECLDNKTCDFSSFENKIYTFRINGILKAPLTEQQRPIKITLWGASETASSILWNSQIFLPELKLGNAASNNPPLFTSEPSTTINIGAPYSYLLSATDKDNSDQVTFSLKCPTGIYCENASPSPEGMKIEDDILKWDSPIIGNKPHIISVYASDGKSTAIQQFNLTVLPKDQDRFSCIFTPAIPVKVFDITQSTPFILSASLSSKISSVGIRFLKEGQLEKTIEYTFSDPQTSIFLDENSNPKLAYTFTEGTYSIETIITGANEKTYNCNFKNPNAYNILERIFNLVLSYIIKPAGAADSIVAGSNVAPTFSTNPSSSTPSLSFTVGSNYRYILTAQDSNGDPLQYKVVTKPTWATVSVTENNAGRLSLQLIGTPSTGGSNMFSVSVNDGYGHFITQTWIVNVNFSNNDIPIITISDPTKAIIRAQGQKVTLAWTASDRNQIVKYNLFYSKTPGGTLTSLQSNIDYRTQSLLVDTASLSPGDYYFVLQATDNQNPAAVGQAITPLIKIVPRLNGTPSPTPVPTTPPVTTTPSLTPTTTPTSSITATPSPSVTIEPTAAPIDVSIAFIQPKEGDKISSADFRIVARVEASPNEKLKSTDIKVLVDDQDISTKIKFSTEEGTTLSLTYEPATLLTVGNHSLKISAKDSAGKTGERSISFSVTALTIDETTEDTTDLFGFIIPNTVRNIIFIGIAILIVALILPLLLYASWRASKKNIVPVTMQAPMVQAQKPILPSPRPMPYQSVTPIVPVQQQVPQRSPSPVTPVQIQPQTAQKPVAYQPENSGITVPVIQQGQTVTPTMQDQPAKPVSNIPMSHNVPTFVQPKPITTTLPAEQKPIAPTPIQQQSVVQKPTQFSEIKGPTTVPQKVNPPITQPPQQNKPF